MESAEQYIFTYGSPEEKLQLIRALEQAGFANHQAIGPEEPEANHVHAFCADVKSRSFYYINATCAAGWAQAGKPFLRASDCGAIPPLQEKKRRK